VPREANKNGFGKNCYHLKILSALAFNYTHVLNKAIDLKQL
tara:strand:+ start:1110 stop:1232 length:123 start_codon:yes stop_codon:yes gene_type:complete